MGGVYASCCTEAPGASTAQIYGDDIEDALGLRQSIESAYEDDVAKTPNFEKLASGDVSGVGPQNECIVFLDVDGVLNHAGGPPRKTRPLDIGCLQHFGRLLRDCPQVQIVMSSTWRRDKRLVTKLLDALAKHADCPPDRVVDHTPILSGRDFRQQEIMEWIKVHPNVSRWAILDDLRLDIQNAVWVDPACGLTKANVESALEYLQGNAVIGT